MTKDYVVKYTPFQCKWDFHGIGDVKKLDLSCVQEKRKITILKIVLFFRFTKFKCETCVKHCWQR